MHKTFRTWPWLAAVAIILLAVLLRFWNLGQTPCGLFGDQALNGLEVIRGKILPYYSFYGEHDEGLFISSLIILSRFIGIGQWQIFAGTAVYGSIVVGLAIFVIRRLSGDWPLALLSGSFLAVSPWAIALSRNGLRATTAPIFILLAAWTAYEWSVAGRRFQSLWSFAFGLAIGAGFYSYSAFRAVAPIFLLITLYALLKRRFFQLLLVIAAASLTLIPLAVAFLHQPAELTSRAGQVSIFKSGHFSTAAGLFTANFKGVSLSLLGFGGDWLWRNNLNGEPLLPVFLSPFFLIGLLTLIYKSIKGSFSSFLIITVFVSFLFPFLFAYDTPPPHDMRLVGELPIVFGILSFGLILSFRKLKKIIPPAKYLVFPLALLIPFLAIHSFQLLQMAGIDPRFASEFQCDHTEIAQSLAGQYANLNSRHIYIIGSLFDRYPIDFLRSIHGLPLTKNLDPGNLSYETVQKGDLIVAPVYGQFGFYHLDDPSGHTILPWGSQNFLRNLALKYPDLRIVDVHYSPTPHRYPQGISFITLMRL